VQRLFAVTLALAALVSCSDPRDSTTSAPEVGVEQRVAVPLAFDFRSPDEGQARCRFIIDPNIYTTPDATPLPEARWTTFVDGPCRYHFYPPVTNSPEEGGTVILTEMGGQTRTDTVGDIDNAYFVYLNFRDREFLTADGSWNGTREATHAHTTIGSVPDYPMRRDGECWVSDRARICLMR
jgi:hypothetical protein